MRQQLDETCRSDAALVLPIPRGVADDVIRPTGPPGAVLPEVPSTELPGSREQVATIGASVPFTDSPRLGAQTVPLLTTSDGVARRVVLVYLERLNEHVVPVMEPLAPGELALSRTNAGQLGVDVADELLTEDHRTLTVAHVFDDIPIAPVPDAWCGFRGLVEPSPLGDLPPLSALVSEATVAQFNNRNVSYIEYRITTDPVTLTDISASLAAYQAANEAWRAAFPDQVFTPGRSELPSVYARAKAVSVTVERSLAPVRLTSLLSVAGVLVAAAVLMARERRRELRLLAVRGVHPGRIALGATPSVLTVAAPAAALGCGLAWLTVTQLGPASLLERHAVVSAAVATTLCLVVALATVVGTVACVADRSVDRDVGHRSFRWLLPMAGVCSVALTAWSFHRLDSSGGIRTFGVEARGGDLLPLGFPLFALLTITALVAFGLRWVVVAARLSGAWLPRALRLGWRRVVMEAGPTVATIAAVSLASGSLITATALSDGAQRQLVEKAQVFVGSDLAVAVFDDPVLAPEVEARSTLALTARAKYHGDRVDLWGIDPDTFTNAAVLRYDASNLSLRGLVSLLDPPSADGLPSAIASGGTWVVGDVVSLELPGATLPLDVKVVAVADFFPGKASGAALIAVDRSVVASQVKFPLRKLLVRDPPADLIESLRAADVRVGVVLNAGSTFHASNFSGLRWAYRPLALLGLLFAVMAAAVQFLVVAARRDTRRAAYVVMRRTGFRKRSLWLAAIIEAAMPLVLGVALGVGAALGASALAVVRLDPMPLLTPPARFVMPWETVLTVLAVAPVWVLITAFIIVRATVRADPMRAIRGDQ